MHVLTSSTLDVLKNRVPGRKFFRSEWRNHGPNLKPADVSVPDDAQSYSTRIMLNQILDPIGSHH